MLKKTRKIALMGGALAAISFGGSALAAAGAAPVQPTRLTVAAPTKADKETADGTPGTAQKGDTETADGGSSESETGSEVPGNDGPGGHADEPGNPNAQNEE